MSRKVEITVGVFMILVICSVLFLFFRVTDPSSFTRNSSFRVYAVFENIGGLKARSPVKIGGVVVGRVMDIILDEQGEQPYTTYKPYVTIDIDARYTKIPSNSSLAIKTAGLLGEQFIDISLGLDNSIVDELDALDALDGDSTSQPAQNEKKNPPYLVEGFVIHTTTPAMVIEDLIGQFLYSSGPDSADKKSLNGN